MPILGSLRRKTEANAQAAQINNTDYDTSERNVSVDCTASQNGPKSAPLRAKASSPQLLPRTSTDATRRPGLNRNFSKSWYGTWNNKASPTAEVARESISVAGGLTSESSDQQRSNSAQYMHNSLKRPRKSVPLAAEATRVNATDRRTSSDKPPRMPSTPVVEKPASPTQSKQSEETLRSDTQPAEVPKDAAADSAPQMKEQPGGAAWFGWWSRPDGYANSETNKDKDDASKGSQKHNEHTGSAAVPVPATTRSEATAAISTSAPVPETAQAPDQPARAWFGLWSATQNQKAPSMGTEGEATKVGEAPQQAAMEPAETSPASLAATAEAATEAARARTHSDARPKSSGWAFWSKDQSKDQQADSDGPQKHLGEIAVADTPSQSHPEAAQFNEEPETKTKQKQKQKKKPAKTEPVPKEVELKGDKATLGTNTGTEGKGPKAVKRTLLADHAFATSAKSASTTSLPLPDVRIDESKKEEAKVTPATKALKAQQPRPNIIEPRFETAYPPAHVPTYWETLGYYIAYPFGLAPAAPPSARHVMALPHKPKIKNAIAIGVHGYFPAPLVQKIIGQPTGTSIRFASHAAAAIRSWVDKNQPDTPCEIEQVALEGEGFIADRVSTLWKLLLNWLSHLRNADFILVAAHSQGVPVAVMLVAKLIQLGCLNPNAKLGICAMAGVNLGPFADYKSRFFGGSAAELFDFSRPDSRVSREYSSAIDVVLRHGVRITYVGSLDDQLVSLESSLFSNLTHPYVQRAVFVDGRVHAPDFITHLVAFALKLRNLGISDHSLIRELSLPLAGSIYGGEGHSRVYDDEVVYALALQFALETTDVDPKTFPQPGSMRPDLKDRRRSSEQRRSQGGIPQSTMLANSIRRGSMSAALQPGIAPIISHYEIPASGTAANPYFLPWAMRGILEEGEVRTNMQGEVKELIRLFDEWKPTSKALKDVRFRLEAVKSKL
ncbi:hypothetical protein KVT40_001146 [Elsinoe batatas]|uniref:YMC020W-like alpha/beta hydrolase domain-containing protein n=1 Tax=Elsinoe batatas TaxID=2601811 RepID=A0A8K0L8N7_9PEZI|nr:hypothetical protein KVT40_001146 [Elsinoe batatas]